MNRDECIDIIAHELVAAGGPDSDRWEDYPDVGEYDWEAIVARADQIREDLAPDVPVFRTAYQTLADLAAASAAMTGQGV